MQKKKAKAKTARSATPHKDFETKIQSKFLYTKINKTTLDETGVQNLFAEIKDQASENPLVILDMLQTAEVTAGGLQVLSLLTGSTTENKSRMSLLMTNDLARKVEDAGYKGVFHIYNDKKEALRQKTFEMRPDAIHFFNFLRESVLQTLQTITKSKPTAGSMYKRAEGEAPKVDIAGVIGVFDRTYQATVILGFERKAYFSVMGKMHSKEYTELTAEIHGGAAELISQIVDSARHAYGPKGRKIEKSIATIAVGPSVQIFLERNPSMIIPISTEFGEISLEMAARPPA